MGTLFLEQFSLLESGCLTALSHPMMMPFAMLEGLRIIRIQAMHLNSFLQVFSRLGQWEGIEQDIAWGHVTTPIGLARPNIDGPIFIHRAPCRPEGVRLMATAGSGPELLLAVIASHFDDFFFASRC